MVDFNERNTEMSLNEETLSKISGGAQEEDTIQVRCPKCGETFRVTGYKKTLTCPACHKTFEMARPAASAFTTASYDSTVLKC